MAVKLAFLRSRLRLYREVVRLRYFEAHYEKFNEAYKVANAQAEDLRKENRELRAALERR